MLHSVLMSCDLRDVLGDKAQRHLVRTRHNDPKTIVWETGHNPVHCSNQSRPTDSNPRDTLGH